MFQSGVLSAENALPMIAGRWYEDPVRSDDLRRFLVQNIQYIDFTAIRFRGTRSRGVVVGGDYRRKLSDKQVNEMLNFIGSIVPLKPVIGIEQSETEVNLLYSGDEMREVRLQSSGIPETRQSTASKKDQNLVLAAWEEGVLVIETNSSSGVSVIERIGLDRGAQEITLKIQTIIDTPRLPVNLVFNRYYKPYPPLQ
ncbi:MAG TPA: hypothetical protein VFX02_02630 [Gammaproteobacteria bacterium]|nr:hypothetical protein [Gammaproteobacteria bacterium]